MPEGIVIDDLDTGFTVEARHDGSRIRGRRATAIGGRDREFDEGLPDYTRQPGDWSRVSIPSSWGKYRHTVAGAIAGDGSTVGIFAADLPAPGRWQLDYHIPNRVGMGQNIYPRSARSAIPPGIARRRQGHHHRV